MRLKQKWESITNDKTNKTKSTYIKLNNVIYQVPRNNLSVNLVNDHFLKQTKRHLGLSHEYKKIVSTFLPSIYI